MRGRPGKAAAPGIEDTKEQKKKMFIQWRYAGGISVQQAKRDA
jgi:hypothetical protein